MTRYAFSPPILPLLLLTAALASAPARAQADAGTPAGPSLLDAIDAAAGSSAGASSVSSPAPAPPRSSAPATNPIVRAFQSLNPDISVIADGVAGFSQRAPLRLSGDDPDLGGDASHQAAGFNLQELELGFQAAVDPYFRADIFLTIPNLSGLEVEEAKITTTSLPVGLQVKAGIFRSALGRQNGQHLHVQDFVRRPLLNAAYLATDGLRAPGLQVSWLLPVPFFLQLDLEAFSVGAPEDLSMPNSFGGGRRSDFTYTAELKAFFPVTESVSISAGLNGATGVSPGLDGHPELDGTRTFLGGADLYVKYKPANEVGGYFNLAWTTEYFVRRMGPHLDAGLYSQLVARLARRWSVAVREDVLGLPASEIQPLTTKTSLSVVFALSEFARLKAQVEREFTRTAGVPDSTGAYLVAEVSIGAHGAHAF